MPGADSAALARWVARLEALDPTRIELGLQRVRAVFGRLRIAAVSPTLIIAGTNGKGSVATFLDDLLRRLGYRCGLYTSPHLLHFNERIRIDGVPVGDAALVAAFERVERARDEIALSYFEFTTLAALVVFEAAGCNALVLEVGLGGRLDAVNVLEPDAAILTNVGYDHQQWLGDTLEAIGREKAGVFRSARPAVVASREPPITVIEAIQGLSADGRLLGRDFDHDGDGDGVWRWSGAGLVLSDLPAVAGPHQRDNLSAALAALAALSLLSVDDAPKVREAIRTGRPPARLEFLRREQRWLLDVAHNVESVQQLVNALRAQSNRGPITLVFGAMADKPIAAMLACLAPLVTRWLAVAAPLERALPAPALARQMANVSGRPALIGGTPLRGMQMARRVTPADGLIVVAGSFPVVGAIRAAL